MSDYLQILSLTKKYSALTALDGITFSIPRGAVLALLGPNGAGKSTLFGCLLGLTRPTDGEIQMDGHHFIEADRARVGYLAERPELYPQRTVLENGEFFAKLKSHSRRDFEQQLERVGLYGARDTKVRQLSKGMLQRVALAVALCGQPQFLLLDEPFSGLDPSWLKNLHAILEEENRRGATLLISTHNCSAVESLATLVAVLLNGRLAAFGAIEDLRAKYDVYGADNSLEALYHKVAQSQRTNLDAVRQNLELECACLRRSNVLGPGRAGKLHPVDAFGACCARDGRTSQTLGPCTSREQVEEGTLG